MFDECPGVEKQSDARQESSDDQKSTWWLGRWAHVITIPVWFILFVSFADHPWGTYISVAGGYTAFVLCLALGNAFKDMDDVLGNPRALIYIAKLLIPHAFILALIVWGVSEWLHLAPTLPSWLTHEGRKGSLWYWCGMLPLGCAGYCQGLRMASMRRKHCQVDEG
jgi:hypothetical protein